MQRKSDYKLNIKLSKMYGYRLALHVFLLEITPLCGT